MIRTGLRRLLGAWLEIRREDRRARKRDRQLRRSLPRAERRWRAGLPDGALVAPAGDWAGFDVGTIVDVASWSMPPRREWPMAWPEDGFGPRRVEPLPRGPQAVRIVSRHGGLVAYEVVR